MIRRSVPWRLVAALTLLLSVGCLEPSDSPDDPDAGRTDTAQDGVEWPPTIDLEADTAEIGPGTTSVSLLDGEVTLTFEEGGPAEPTQVEISRRLVDVGGIDLVGYIWGPHGMPIDPPARVRVEVPVRWVPGDAPREARLAFVRDDGLHVLPVQGPPDVGETVVLEAEVNALETLVIGVAP